MQLVKLCSEKEEKIILADAAELANGDICLTVSAEKVGKGYDYADVFYDFFRADEKDKGYYVIPDLAGGKLVRFKETEGGGKYSSENLSLRMIGCLKNGIGYVGKIVGMSDEYKLLCNKENGEYRYFLRFPLEGREPYEDIKIILHKSVEPDFDYNAMTRWYREKGIESGEITPLKEKVKNDPVTQYAADSVYVRIRMAWKPAPPQILEQTRENEPELHVACTFSMVEELIDELKAAGVEKADICLVGWNVSGHDGRWPEIFPVEPKLGGEEGLKKLIAKAEKAGYMLNLHTNFTDAYSIAEDYSEDIIIKNADGSLAADAPWSGGRMYNVAVKYVVESFVEKLKKIAELGLKGMHYVDVVSAVPPRRSYDPKFPMNPKEFTDSSKKIMGEMKKLFGGVSSESGVDHTIEKLDYVLYGEFPGLWKRPEFKTWTDEQIPLWFLVYHGSVLYNPDTRTINHVIKEKEKTLRILETGARPVAYCFVDFIEGCPNWGKEDIVWTKKEKPKEAARIIAEMNENYKEYKALQFEFIKSHKCLDDGVYQVCYENGAEVIVDYKNQKYSIKNA